MSVASEVAKRLLQIKAIKLNPQNPFTWASGIKSPIYCDNRIILSHPNIRDYVIYCLEKKATSMPEFDVVAGVATAGIAFGALLADRLKKPMVYVRSKAKEHGRQNMIEGQLEGTERILVIEDLISTGQSSLKAVAGLRSAGVEVKGLLAIFTYGFDAASKAFEEANCSWETLTDYSTMLDQAMQEGYITKDQRVLLDSWNGDPQAWSDKFNGE